MKDDDLLLDVERRRPDCHQAASHRLGAGLAARTPAFRATKGFFQVSMDMAAMGGYEI